MRKDFSIPQVEVYARLVGGIEWVCPACGKINKYTPVSHRNPKVKCRNEGCERSFVVGLMVGQPSDVGLPPGNCRLVPRAKTLACVNRSAQPDTLPAFARISGGVFWLCPRCFHWVYQHPDWDTGVVTCLECEYPQSTGVILHESPTGCLSNRTPIDWVPPRGVYVPNSQEPVAPSETDSGRGKAGKRARKVEEIIAVAPEGTGGF
jgi:hypothetical protein